jgi:hypothetical protein
VEKQQKTLHCHYATSPKKENQVDKALKDKWVMYDTWDPYASKKTFKTKYSGPFQSYLKLLYKAKPHYIGSFFMQDVNIISY